MNNSNQDKDVISSVFEQHQSDQGINYVLTSREEKVKEGEATKDLSEQQAAKERRESRNQNANE